MFGIFHNISKDFPKVSDDCAMFFHYRFGYVSDDFSKIIKIFQKLGKIIGNIQDRLDYFRTDISNISNISKRFRALPKTNGKFIKNFENREIFFPILCEHIRNNYHNLRERSALF